MDTMQLSSFAIRWRTAFDRSKSTGERVFAAAEMVCLPLSFVTFGWLLADIALRRGFGIELVPDGMAFATVGLPIFTAAAIGYVTNWLAIKMLFEPYEPTWRHWIPWITLGFWKQGLLPKNRARMARELGQTFGARLLKPEVLVAELSAKAETFLSRPDVVERFKGEAQALFRDNAGAIAAFLVPEIEGAAGRMLDKLLAPEKIRSFWDETLAPRLADGRTRELIASKIIEVVRRSSPQLAGMFQRELREYVRKAVSDIPLVNLVPGVPDGVSDAIVEFFADEESVRRKVDEWLRKPETSDLMKEKLVLFGEKANEWIRSDEGRAAVGGFAAEIRGKAHDALSTYVREAIPALVRGALNSPKLWNWIEGSALPGLRSRLVGYVADNGDRMLASFDLPGRIEAAVNGLSMKDFHAMLDRLMAQHLSAIQVLGYVLGAVVGALQCL